MGEPKAIEFRDFLTQGGRNAIHEWAHSLPTKARMKMTTLLEHLEGARNWKDCKFVKPLSGPGAGLLELVFTRENVQYRPLMCRGPGPGQVTLLLGATEQGDRFMPRNAIETAQARKKIVEKNPKRTVPHDYS